jgi:capsid protein
MVFDGYWPNRFDANRGVSPLLTALNEAADIRETWEWLVLKAKTAALFGLAFIRKGSDDMAPTSGEDATAAPTSEASAYSAQLSAAVKSRGIISLDLDEGDDVKEVNSNTPNPTVIPFTRELIRSVLLALDIPFTFYDSLTASFSARIADRNEYEEACEWKRDKNADVLHEVYGDWLFPMWAKADLFGFGKALTTAKLSTDEVAAALRWIPAGRPWLDRTNEMSGHLLAIAAGIESIPEVCAMYGKDAYLIAQEQEAYLSKAGAPLFYAQGGQMAVQAIMAAMGGSTQPEAQPPAQPKGEGDE